MAEDIDTKEKEEAQNGGKPSGDSEGVLAPGESIRATENPNVFIIDKETAEDLTSGEVYNRWKDTEYDASIFKEDAEKFYLDDLTDKNPDGTYKYPELRESFVKAGEAWLEQFSMKRVEYVENDQRSWWEKFKSGKWGTALNFLIKGGAVGGAAIAYVDYVVKPIVIEGTGDERDDNLIKATVEALRFSEQNSMAMVNTAFASKNWTPEAIEAGNWLQDAHSRTKISFKGSLSAIEKGIILDPVTYLTAGIGGTAGQGVKLAGKEALKQVGKQAAKETVKKGFFSKAKDFAKNSVVGLAVRGRWKEAGKAFAKPLSLIGFGEGAGQGALDDTRTQTLQISGKFKDNFSAGSTTLSGFAGGTLGTVLGDAAPVVLKGVADEFKGLKRAVNEVWNLGDYLDLSNKVNRDIWDYTADAAGRQSAVEQVSRRIAVKAGQVADDLVGEAESDGTPDTDLSVPGQSVESRWNGGATEVPSQTFWQKLDGKIRGVARSLRRQGLFSGAFFGGNDKEGLLNRAFKRKPIREGDVQPIEEAILDETPDMADIPFEVTDVREKTSGWRTSEGTPDSEVDPNTYQPIFNTARPAGGAATATPTQNTARNSTGGGPQSGTGNNGNAGRSGSGNNAAGGGNGSSGPTGGTGPTPPPPQPTPPPNPTGGGGAPFKLPKFKRKIDWFKVWMRRSSNPLKLFTTWAPVTNMRMDSKPVTKPVIDCIDQLFQGNGGASSNLMKRLRNLQNDILDAVEAGDAADAIDLIDSFATDNAAALSNLQAQLSTLRSHVNSNFITLETLQSNSTAMKWLPHTLFAGPHHRKGITATQKKNLLEFIDDMENVAADLQLGTGGVQGGRMMDLVSLLESGALTTDEIRESASGLSQAHFLANNTYTRLTGNWADGSGKATYQWKDALSRSIDDGYYNNGHFDDPVSITVLKNENIEKPWQNQILPFYKKKGVGVPSDKGFIESVNWDDTNVSTFADLLKEVYDAGYGHEVFYMIDELSRRRQTLGQPELYTFPGASQLAKAFTGLGGYTKKGNDRYSIWVDKLLKKAKDENTMALGAPKFLTGAFQRNRPNRNFYEEKSYPYRFATRFPGGGKIATPGKNYWYPRLFTIPPRQAFAWILGAKKYGITVDPGNSMPAPDIRFFGDDESFLAVPRRAILRILSVGLLDDFRGWVPRLTSFGRYALGAGSLSAAGAGLEHLGESNEMGVLEGLGTGTEWVGDGIFDLSTYPFRHGYTDIVDPLLASNVEGYEGIRTAVKYKIEDWFKIGEMKGVDKAGQNLGGSSEGSSPPPNTQQGKDTVPSSDTNTILRQEDYNGLGTGTETDTVPQPASDTTEFEWPEFDLSSVDIPASGSGSIIDTDGGEEVLMSAVNTFNKGSAGTPDGPGSDILTTFSNHSGGGTEWYKTGYDGVDNFIGNAGSNISDGVSKLFNNLENIPDLLGQAMENQTTRTIFMILAGWAMIKVVPSLLKGFAGNLPIVNLIPQGIRNGLLGAAGLGLALWGILKMTKLGKSFNQGSGAHIASKTANTVVRPGSAKASTTRVDPFGLSSASKGDVFTGEIEMQSSYGGVPVTNGIVIPQDGKGKIIPLGNIDAGQSSAKIIHMADREVTPGKIPTTSHTKPDSEAAESRYVEMVPGLRVYSTKDINSPAAKGTDGGVRAPSPY